VIEQMMTENLELTLACPMHEELARARGLPPGTCRLLVTTRQDARNRHRRLAELLVRGFPRAAPIWIRAIGPFRPLRDVVQLLGIVTSDSEGLCVNNAEQIASVLAEWRAEELVIAPCDLSSNAIGIAPASALFKLTPSGHMHRFAGVIESCGPIANYSADHGSLECFGSEDQIMHLYQEATVMTEEE
jgi:hypothetical protein